MQVKWRNCGSSSGTTLPENLKAQNPDYAKGTFAILNWKMYHFLFKISQGFLLENFYFSMKINNIMKQWNLDILRSTLWSLVGSEARVSPDFLLHKTPVLIPFFFPKTDLELVFEKKYKTADIFHKVFLYILTKKGSNKTFRFLKKTHAKVYFLTASNLTYFL